MIAALLSAIPAFAHKVLKGPNGGQVAERMLTVTRSLFRHNSV